MKKYSLRKAKTFHWKKIIVVLFVVAALITGGVLVTVKRIYTQNLRAVQTNEGTEVVVGIPSGSSLDEITEILKNAGLIRADWAFKQYVRGKELTDKLQAGTYRLSTGMDVVSIVEKLSGGDVAVDLFTILPGQRLDQIRQAFIDEGYSTDAVDKALDPKQYASSPALVDKPNGATLEGYLYPDSFQKTADTLPETIIRASLAEMGDYLTAELRSAYAAKNLTTHQAITLASVVEREVSSTEDRATAAQVFFLRMKKGMRLQSDVTVLYGQAIAGKDTKYVDTSFDSAYNTFLYDGLPVGPISNVTKSGLQAVANPSNTDFLYFVAGDGDDYGKTYFTRTIAEHQAAVRAHCSSCSPQ